VEGCEGQRQGLNQRVTGTMNLAQDRTFYTVRLRLTRQPN
jgi:hypothetical protein